MKNTNRHLVLLSFLFLLTVTAVAQQLPSEKPKAELLNSQLKQKAEKLQQQMAGAPRQKTVLPSMTDPKQKSYPSLQVNPRPIAEGDKVKMLPSNATKMRPPIRRPGPQH